MLLPPLGSQQFALNKSVMRHFVTQPILAGQAHQPSRPRRPDFRTAPEFSTPLFPRSANSTGACGSRNCMWQ
eukprot:6370803-Alexandrium_andersonii.AAC.1